MHIERYQRFLYLGFMVAFVLLSGVFFALRFDLNAATCTAEDQCLPRGTENACTSDEQCTSGVCANGYCACNIPTGSNSNECGSTLSCVSVAVPDQQLVGYCLKPAGLGSPCSSGSMCRSDVCTNGKCAPGGEDTKCYSQADCQESLYCDVSSTYTCTVKKAAGDACVKSFECGSNSCKNKKCAVGKSGSTCVTNSDCGDGLFCDDGDGLNDPVCASKVSVGNFCKNNDDCVTNKCEPSTGGKNVCAIASVGGSCATTKDCGDAAFCDGSTCKTKLAKNAECANDDQCAGGQCDKGDSKTAKKGKCTDLISSVGMCFKDADCQVNQYCDVASCHDKLEGEASCTDDHECLSNACVAGTDGTKKCTATSGGSGGAPSVAPPKTTAAELKGDIGEKLKKFDGLGLISSDVPSVIGLIIRTAFGLIGSIALAMFVYGGIMWMTAGGSEDKVKKARNTFLWATLGLIAVFMSYAVISYVISVL